MTHVTKFAAAFGLALTLGGAAFAQQDDGNVEALDLVGVDCGDFLEAEASTQTDYAESLGVDMAAMVELPDDAIGDVDTINDNVRAIAAACEGHEEVELLDLETVVVEMNGMDSTESN
ncbi:HdeA/HdeB family chaperone [Wenxinia marina]|uniref:HdeA/HdeB family protein n=1 Tax=Wenxinia marina DSM 24838 TaxID=1123501 RepID=A0A0D0Q501_9RHOB|nr:HdeA/HdeB family chaperone [Wenxinia marina]KIQ67597.1 hypothetical protein Wenmar_04023 [Wenxinia marina DSM 24838]GGL68215.1 hypothetical protein GCM10011392_23340 [Wenxinia marina]